MPLIQPEFLLTQLSRMTGLDLIGFDLDDPFPHHLTTSMARMALPAVLRLAIGIIDRETPTIRQLVRPSLAAMLQ
ncbi:hypothetical protein [Bradyrhizobium sp. CCBAU 53415]|uniref:hypothetical protein n=1 Tax=Bradyrhizobium sp. CCBAU 53415 TaxID=1325119 RepID=UPI0023062581|nr:hypothetical protein [Bradyrhizobium sp. CCBAU 53415]